jgi:hypothetical protein
MQITSTKRAIATKFDWHGVGGPTVWFSVDGMGDDRMPVVVTPDQMHEIAIGTRRFAIEVRCEYESCYVKDELERESDYECGR